MMRSLFIHVDAARDLRELMQLQPDAAAKVLALLEEAQCNPQVLDSLLDHDFGKGRSKHYHVSKWLSLWRSGYNVWRLKVWTTPSGSLDYRIVYAYDRVTQVHHVLAVVHRDFDYRRDHEITQRILRAYDKLGLARF